MKSRLHRIEICNFKAFCDFALDLEGRHLLVYGANGSGKSSLYWALYTFLHSARKPKNSIAKYFAVGDKESLLNIHQDAKAKPGNITFSFRDEATKIDTSYNISESEHSTHNEPLVLKGELASDFVTYRFFFGFSDFRNSENFDLWPLFEEEILPFCVSTSGEMPLDSWQSIKSGEPNPLGSGGAVGADAYATFSAKTDDFSSILTGIVDSISIAAQEFYDKHFARDDSQPIHLKLGVTVKPSATGGTQQDFAFTLPVIEFAIQVNSMTISRPQSYLNEAKMTQLALSVRFAASLVNLQKPDADLKLLVLDDLLVSLDMSNRMKVVEILLSDAFSSYQKIIMTHDHGLFNEVKRQAQCNEDWLFLSLEGNSLEGIVAKEEKRPIEKAEAYFSENKLEEAAQHLRIAAEENMKNYRQVVLNQDVADGFVPLAKHIDAARKHYESLILRRSKQAMSQCGSVDYTDEDKTSCEIIGLMEQLAKMKDRVLNPAAHWNEVPLYEAEVSKALDIVTKLEELIIPKS